MLKLSFSTVNECLLTRGFLMGRIRYQVQYANPLNFAQEANKLAALIKQYSIGGDSLFVN